MHSVEVQESHKVVRSQFRTIERSSESGPTCNQNVQVVRIILAHCKCSSESCFLGSSQNEGQSLAFDDIINLLSDFGDSPFGSDNLVFGLQADIAIVCDIDLLYGDSIFRIVEWAYFGEESSEAAWGIVFSALVDASFARKVEGYSDDDYISVAALFDEPTEPGIVVDHLLVLVYL
jgi:hypothetical protein